MQPGPLPRILTSNQDIRREFADLRAGDICLGRLRLKASEESLLVDLLERGVRLFPSALSQLLSRSKTLQARVYARQMLPHTVAIHDQHDMLEAVNRYRRQDVNRVVTKLDRKNAGMGILLWQDVEEVFSHSSLGTLPFPFVLQPFAEKSSDIRVVMLGDYVEAYHRRNPDNFRNNLHCGGVSTPCQLSEEQRDFCLMVMARGGFPYAHLDLMVLANGETWLAEINLRGGIRGARISPSEYQRQVEKIHRQFLAGTIGKRPAEVLR